MEKVESWLLFDEVTMRQSKKRKGTLERVTEPVVGAAGAVVNTVKRSARGASREAGHVMKSIGEAVSEGAEAVKDAGAKARAQRQWIGFLREQIALGEDRDEEKRFLIACEVAYQQWGNLDEEFLVPHRLDLVQGQGFQAQGLGLGGCVQEQADREQDLVLDIWQFPKTRHNGFGIDKGQACEFHDQESSIDRSSTGRAPRSRPVRSSLLMAQSDTATNAEEILELVGLVALDTRRLLDQHVQLIRGELRQELGAIPSAVASIGAGAGLAAVGGGLSALMAVHFLHRYTRLPLWGCYGLVAGLLGVTGSCLFASGTRRAANINLVPRESIGALREDVAWIKKQLTTRPS